MRIGEVLRRRAPALAVAVLAAACAPTTPAPPVGSRVIQAHVSNPTGDPVELSITTPGLNRLPGAVQPVSTVPAGTTMELLLYVPAARDWALNTNGHATRIDIDRALTSGCRLDLVLRVDGFSARCIEGP